ncbi:Protein FAM83D, partial [Merops nubicus]
QVIALVMDSFTDIDIFGDLQDAFKNRQVPVYILLGQDSVQDFLEMCKNLGVCPEQESLLRVRTLTGSTYYLRSGAKIVGKVHEKFMLIDCIRVTTGSYSFTWSDGKLNSSNLLLLSGQVVEHFDLQFRILYAQSMPISPPSCRSSGMFDHLLSRSPEEYTAEGNWKAEFIRLASTPKRLLKEPEEAEDTPGGQPCELRSFLPEEEWLSPHGAVVGHRSTSTQTGPWAEEPLVTTCHVGTQTSPVVAEAATQASVTARVMGTQTSVPLRTAVTQTGDEGCTDTPLPPRRLAKEGSALDREAVWRSSLLSLSSSSSSQCSAASSTGSLSSLRSFDYSSSHRAECFQKLHKERQFHYSTIRSKLSHMVDILSRR